MRKPAPATEPAVPGANGIPPAVPAQAEVSVPPRLVGAVGAAFCDLDALNNTECCQVANDLVDALQDADRETAPWVKAATEEDLPEPAAPRECSHSSLG